mmetsp:Transcript_6169/g.18634  ORF Transcript_6169/g.18634 Transcript_6169/m.18634 type:complete len:204 (-) Transcript_6169:872-1483(-)
MLLKSLAYDWRDVATFDQGNKCCQVWFDTMFPHVREHWSSCFSPPAANARVDQGVVRSDAWPNSKLEHLVEYGQSFVEIFSSSVCIYETVVDDSVWFKACEPHFCHEALNHLCISGLPVTLTQRRIAHCIWQQTVTFNFVKHRYSAAIVDLPVREELQHDIEQRKARMDVLCIEGMKDIFIYRRTHVKLLPFGARIRDELVSL